MSWLLSGPLGSFKTIHQLASFKTNAFFQDHLSYDFFQDHWYFQDYLSVDIFQDYSQVKSFKIIDCSQDHLSVDFKTIGFFQDHSSIDLFQYHWILSRPFIMWIFSIPLGFLFKIIYQLTPSRTIKTIHQLTSIKPIYQLTSFKTIGFYQDHLSDKIFHDHWVLSRPFILVDWGKLKVR